MTDPPAPDQLPPSRRMPETEDFPSGPAVGEALPDFELPDQRGEPVAFRAQDGPAYVVFIRSTRW